jgi:hypothetical protein
MRIKFDGEEADNHRLEAYEGIKSIEGLIRVARIATHYSATNEVRFRAPYTNLLEAQISSIINGSFEMLFDYASRITDSVTSGAAKSRAEALFNYLVRRGTGQLPNTEDTDFIEIGGEKMASGDVAAMGEAAESGLKAAHRWINKETKKISLIDGHSKIVLDKKTKIFVEEEIIGPEMTQDVSVAAINVNSRNGRVYLFNEGRTVPFQVHRDANPRTISNLSRYVLKYADKKPETVNIEFQPIYHINEKLKRLIIFDCFEASDD